MDGKSHTVWTVLGKLYADIASVGIVFRSVALAVQQAVVGGTRLVRVHQHGILAERYGMEADKVKDFFDEESLSGFDKEELDNIIVIDNDFRWESPESPDGLEVNTEPPVRIGPKKSSKKFARFEEKPSLCVKPGEKTADLEHIPAVRRQ